MTKNTKIWWKTLTLINLILANRRYHFLSMLNLLFSVQESAKLLFFTLRKKLAAACQLNNVLLKFKKNLVLRFCSWELWCWWHFCSVRASLLVSFLSGDQAKRKLSWNNKLKITWDLSNRDNKTSNFQIFLIGVDLFT